MGRFKLRRRKKRGWLQTRPSQSDITKDENNNEGSQKTSKPGYVQESSRATPSSTLNERRRRENETKNEAEDEGMVSYILRTRTCKKSPQTPYTGKVGKRTGTKSGQRKATTVEIHGGNLDNGPKTNCPPVSKRRQVSNRTTLHGTRREESSSHCSDCVGGFVSLKELHSHLLSHNIGREKVNPPPIVEPDKSEICAEWNFEKDSECPPLTLEPQNSEICCELNLEKDLECPPPILEPQNSEICCDLESPPLIVEPDKSETCQWNLEKELESPPPIVEPDKSDTCCKWNLEKELESPPPIVEPDKSETCQWNLEKELESPPPIVEPDKSETCGDWNLEKDSDCPPPFLDPQYSEICFDWNLEKDSECPPPIVEPQNSKICCDSESPPPIVEPDKSEVCSDWNLEKDLDYPLPIPDPQNSEVCYEWNPEKALESPPPIVEPENSEICSEWNPEKDLECPPPILEPQDSEICFNLNLSQDSDCPPPTLEPQNSATCDCVMCTDWNRQKDLESHVGTCGCVMCTDWNVKKCNHIFGACDCETSGAESDKEQNPDRSKRFASKSRKEKPESLPPNLRKERCEIDEKDPMRSSSIGDVTASQRKAITSGSESLKDEKRAKNSGKTSGAYSSQASGSKFTSMADRIKNRKRKHSDRKSEKKKQKAMVAHTCVSCEKGFDKFQTLVEHIKDDHEEALKEKFNDRDKKKMKKTKISCISCNRQFKNRKNLLRHLRSHLQSASFCPVCQRAFDNHCEMEKHLGMHSKCEARGLVASNPERTNTLAHNVTEHQDPLPQDMQQTESDIVEEGVEIIEPTMSDISHDENGGEGIVIAATTISQDLYDSLGTDMENLMEEGFQQALRTEAGQSHVCEHCTLSFPTLELLLKHELDHVPGNDTLTLSTNDISTAKDVTRCQVCGQAFKSAFEKLSHCDPNKGATECILCAGSFETECELNVHAKQHTCSVCNWKYTSADNYLTHWNGKSGESSLHCGICDMRFKSECSLMLHSKFHTDNLPLGYRKRGRVSVVKPLQLYKNDSQEIPRVEGTPVILNEVTEKFGHSSSPTSFMKGLNQNASIDLSGEGSVTSSNKKDGGLSAQIDLTEGLSEDSDGGKELVNSGLMRFCGGKRDSSEDIVIVDDEPQEPGSVHDQKRPRTLGNKRICDRFDVDGEEIIIMEESNEIAEDNDVIGEHDGTPVDKRNQTGFYEGKTPANSTGIFSNTSIGVSVESGKTSGSHECGEYELEFQSVACFNEHMEGHGQSLESYSKQDSRSGCVESEENIAAGENIGKEKDKSNLCKCEQCGAEFSSMPLFMVHKYLHISQGKKFPEGNPEERGTRSEPTRGSEVIEVDAEEIVEIDTQGPTRNLTDLTEGREKSDKELPHSCITEGENLTICDEEKEVGGACKCDRCGVLLENDQRKHHECIKGSRRDALTGKEPRSTGRMWIESYTAKGGSPCIRKLPKEASVIDIINRDDSFEDLILSSTGRFKTKGLPEKEITCARGKPQDINTSDSVPTRKETGRKDLISPDSSSSLGSPLKEKKGCSNKDPAVEDQTDAEHDRVFSLTEALTDVKKNLLDQRALKGAVYECGICREDFVSFAVFEKHISQHNDWGVPITILTEMEEGESRAGQNSSLGNIQKQGLRVETSGHFVRSEKGLINVSTQNVPVLTSGDVNKQGMRKVYECPVCLDEFETLVLLRRHAKTHSKKYSTVCARISEENNLKLKP